MRFSFDLSLGQRMILGSVGPGVVEVAAVVAAAAAWRFAPRTMAK